MKYTFCIHLPKPSKKRLKCFALKPIDETIIDKKISYILYIGKQKCIYKYSKKKYRDHFFSVQCIF